MEVGDKVLYVPSEVHAKHKNSDGEYAWVIGRKLKGVLTELSTREAEKFLATLRGSIRGGSRSGELICIRPNCSWPALVGCVNSDGTVAIDVDCGGNGVTLHLDSVKVDQVDKKPGTVHVGDGTNVDHMLAHRYSKIQCRGSHEFSKTGA